MHPIRIIRRLHAPIICVLIACLVSAGCKRGAWSEERYTLQTPSDAYVADDGTLLLSTYITRKYRDNDEGWHWLIVEPDCATELLDASMLPQDVIREDVQELQSRTLKWRDVRAINLWPPIRRSGQTRAAPPEQYTGLERWGVEPLQGGDFVLIPAGCSAPLGVRYHVSPGTVQRDTSAAKLLKVLKAPLIIPALAIGAVMFVGLVFLLVVFQPEWSFGP